MVLLLALIGLVSMAGLGSSQSEDMRNGMPPLMIVSPPDFKAGHMTNLKLMLFTENSGNISFKYYNYTRQYIYGGGYDYEENVLKERTIDISADDKIIDIPIEVPEVRYGTHVVKFSGFMEEFGSFEFERETMSVRTTGYKTYVQTDKPVYKPGQPIRFRGFSIDSDLKGLMLPEGLKVKITNPDGIEVFDQTIFNDGGIIHEGIFLLAEEVKIGDYRITVTGRNSASCSFSVEEYVLPKFGVEIEGPGHIGADDTIIKGKVSATYTYGKPVNGKLILKFAIDSKSQTLYSGSYFFKEITMDLVEGKADWEIDITDVTTKRLKYLFNPWCRPSNLVISASVSDAEGGFNVEKVDSSTKFSQSSLKLTFNKNTQKNYVAGFPFYVELDVEALTASEIENMPVKLTMISGLSDLKYVSEKVVVQDGKVFFSFDVPDDACALKITAEMDIETACDSVFACFQPERMVAKSDEFLRFIKTEPVSYNAGDMASYRLLSNKKVETLHFIIMSKGNIVQSWNVVPKWEEQDSGKFLVNGSMVIPPDIIVRSRLIVLTANRMTGFVLADAIDLCMYEDLRHNVALQLDTMTAKPGQNVTFYLTSDPRSFVGINVNDASLNLIREPCKVLTKESTLSFLRDLDSGSTKDLSCKRDDPYQCKSNTEVKIIDVKDLLESEGLELSTNMNMFDYIPPATPQKDYYPHYYYGAGMRQGSGRPIIMESKAYNVYDSADTYDNKNDEIEREVEEAPRMRNFFPEAWLWTDMISDDNGKNVLSVVAPDTITAWKGNAFGLSPEKGLGFSNDIEFKTFLPFFISLDLPYSGTVGERITIPVTIFNYFDYSITANVKITSELWEDKSERVTVPSNRAAKVEYEISLTEAGNHEITVTAVTTTGESDAVEKKLLVQPGGEKVVDTSSLMIMEKDQTGRGKAVLSVELPDSFIPGSHNLKLVAVGDILGEAVSGISNLIQLPSGCGEQNMHKIAINVFSANYLRSLYDELPENIDYNIKHNLNIGLQQQLAYRKGSTSSSNGYSVFKGGPSSDWLTAFVHKVVALFPEDIFVPCENAFNRDRDYLMRQIRYATSAETTTGLNRDGWAPYQYSYHRNNELYWQSYFLISLLESDGMNRCGTPLTDSDYQSNRIGKVCNSSLELVSQSDDCCYHHMVAYSIELCKEHGFFDHVTNWRSMPFRNDGKCMGSSIDGKYKFATCQENLEFESVKGSSKSIEATGYASLYFMRKGMLEESLPMIMWLASQRNDYGGFRSSQDTVIGLQALAKFAELSNADMAGRTDLSLAIGKGGSYFEKVRINDDNKLTTKEVILSPEVGDYKIKWTGAGVAFVQLISKYHITSKDYEPIFRLQAVAATMKGLPTIKIRFTLPEESKSTMYLLEVSAPTGMVFTKSLIEGQLQLTDGGFTAITRYDIKEGGQRLHLYIDPATKLRDIELHVPLDDKFKVVNRMPVQVSLIDYYNPSLRQTVFYSIDDMESDFKDIDEVDCSLSLSCDILQSSEAILLGYPGEIMDDSLDIKSVFPYKACKGNFISSYRANVKFSRQSDRECVKPLMNKRSFFLLRYTDDNQMEIAGMTDYDSVLPKIAECFSVITECPSS